MDNEVSKASVSGRSSDENAGFDPGHLRSARSEDNEGTRGEGPYSPTDIDTAAGDDQSTGAVAEREDGAPAVGGILPPEEAILGQASVGERIFLL